MELDCWNYDLRHFVPSLAMHAVVVCAFTAVLLVLSYLSSSHLTTTAQQAPFSNETRCDLRKYHNLHLGEACVYVGNGPSLNRMDFAFMRHFNVVMGVNKIFLGTKRFGWNPLYYVAVNRFVVEQSRAQIVALPARAKFLSESTKNWFEGVDANIEFVRFTYTDRNASLRCKSSYAAFCYDICDGIHEGATVTYASLQLLYYMGCKLVYLIGVDHSFSQAGKENSVQLLAGPDMNHFDPSYFSGLAWNLADLNDSEAHYRVAKEVFAADNRAIIDATEGGRLQVFEKVDHRAIVRDPWVGLRRTLHRRLGVVIQLPLDQVDRLEWVIRQLWRHKDFYPCKQGGIPVDADLVFWVPAYPNGSWLTHEQGNGWKIRLRRAVYYSHSMDLIPANCFKSVRFLSANLSDLLREANSRSWTNEPFLGKNHMLYKIFQTNEIISRYSYVLPLHADTVPLRRGWLEEAYAQTWHPHDFWMKGSRKYLYPGVQASCASAKTTRRVLTEFGTGCEYDAYSDLGLYSTEEMFLKQLKYLFSLGSVTFAGVIPLATALTLPNEAGLLSRHAFENRIVSSPLIVELCSVSNLTDVLSAMPFTYLLFPGKHIARFPS